MIPFDFDYCKAETIEEAVKAYAELKESKRAPLYYGGGTEIVTLCRKGQISPGALIDIKSIPECRVLGIKGERAVFGSALVLSEIADSKVFPLLARTCRGIADRTVRNRLTLGGNVCGRLPYREAILPFLLCEGEALIAEEKSTRWVPLRAIFDKRLKLAPGEFLVQMAVPKEALELPYSVVRKTKGGHIAYPIVTAAGVKAKGAIRIALSGAFGYPVLLDSTGGFKEDASAAGPFAELIEPFARSFISDVWASSDYRRLLTELSVAQIFEELGVRK
jgi:CO/xanthine dehydrogenase FAD-binding subunit